MRINLILTSHAYRNKTIKSKVLEVLLALFVHTYIPMATSSEQFCSLCHQNHLTSDAVEFCPECEEFLCIDCKRHHSVSKLSKLHTTLSIQEYRELPPFVQSTTGQCREHEKCFEMYCTEHGCPCCIKCLSAHKECISVESIIDVIKDVKVSTSVSDLEQTINELVDYTKRITDKLSRDKADSLNQKTKFLTEIKQARNRINEYLDSLETTVLEALSKTVSGHVCRIESLISEISDAQKRLNFISADMNKTKKYASDFQTFISLREIESLVSAEEQFLLSLDENKRLDYIHILVKTEELLKQIKSVTKFGDIEEHTIACDLTILKKKNKQAQILTPVCRTINDISLSIYNNIEINSVDQIKGCSILSTKNYVISSYSSHRNNQDCVAVKQLNGSQLTLTCIYRNNYDVNDFVLLGDTSFVASSGYNKHCLFLVDYIKDVILRKIPVSGPTSGITIFSRTLIYCVKGKGIESYNLDTDAEKVILKNEQISNSYIAYSDNHLYFTYANAVSCCDMTGNISWTFENKPALEAPRGIAVDKDGYIYVAGKKSGNVVVISPSGEESRLILGREEGLIRPRALKYDQEQHRLLVCNDTRLFVFDIK